MNFLCQAQELLSDLSAEIVLFSAAFLLQFFLFGNVVWPWRRRKNAKARPVAKAHAHDQEQARPPWCPEAAITAAFEKGDYVAVVRKWPALQRNKQAPASIVAQVVESMQRLRRDSASILAEVHGLVHRPGSVRSVQYLNELLAPLARSLDVDLVQGLVEVFASVGVKADSTTYEVLAQLYLATRSFDEVKKLRLCLGADGLEPTSRTSLVLLKAALHAANLDEALRCFREIAASSVPQHVGSQLVELACRDRRLVDVLPELEASMIPMTMETLNQILSECIRSKDDSLTTKVLDLASSQSVEKNSRTYSLLVRAAGSNSARIRQLLEEATSSGDEAGSGVVDVLVAQAVLGACAKTGDVALAERLAEILRAEEPSQVPAILALIRFYADAQLPDKACQAFDRFLNHKDECGKERRAPPMDARTKHSLLAASSACGREDIAIVLEARPFDRKSYSADVAGDSLSAAKKLAPSAWTTAIESCLESCDLGKAKELIKKMRRSDGVDFATYNALMKAFLRRGDLDAALNILEEMHKDDCCSPSNASYQDLVAALLKSAKEGHKIKANELVAKMQTEQVTPTKAVVNALLRNLKPRSNSAEVNCAMQLADSIKSQIDEGLLCSILEAGVRIGKTSLVKKKLELLCEGEDRVKVVGPHSFGTLMKAYGFTKDVAGAWRCWKEMSMQHIKPTSITIGCMVEAIASNGDVDGAHELVQRLLEDVNTKSQVNAVVYGSILKGFSRAGSMDRVWETFEEMKAHNIAPTLMTFNAVMDGCARNGQMNKAAQLISEMKACNIQPSLITQSTMIKGLCARGDMSAAFAALEEIKRGKEAPDEVVYNTMMDGCLQAGLFDDGEWLLDSMMAEGIAPGQQTLSTMVKLLATAKRLDKAFKMAEAASSKFRFRLGSQVVSALVQACISCRAFDRGARFYLKMHSSRSSPDIKACQALIRGLLQVCGKPQLAAEMLRSMLCLDSGSSEATQQRAVDEELASEVLLGLLEGRGGAPTVAAALLEELKSLKPNLCLTGSLERKVKDACGNKIRPPR
eukprot:gb/GFBE01038301.1/.p1 GENE.gb/GFBE01038301.1/~~gb/GFBE01038301.1/.p1  ORF type:complete len:1038 (+),score=274.06 gb/GFBE01038301.1/:1-3114(+)